MDDNWIADIFNQLNSFWTTLLIMGLFIFGIQTLDNFDMSSYINAQIERNGGLTETAMQNIQDYSDKYYDGRYEVQSLNGYDKKTYGDETDYNLVSKTTLLFDLPINIVTMRGSQISLVR